MPDVKGALFWLAVCLVALIWLLNGCGGRMDKFREQRDKRQEDRQERFEERRQERFDWRDRDHRWRRANLS